MTTSFSATPFTKIGTNDAIIDILLIVLVTAFAFGVSFHPFFFGDELIAYELASANDSFSFIFHELNANKPRLVFNGVEALLAIIDAPRATHAMLVAACMAWINILIFTVARYQFSGSRTLAWLLVLGVLGSRYGVMLYFDYLSGLVETLSSALFLTTLLLAWLAYRKEFDLRCAAGALLTAIVTGLVHERYMAGSLAIACVIVVAECLGASARRRTKVVGWALSLGFAPVIVYWLSVKAVGSLPITTVGGDQRVSLGADTLWTMLTFGYDVLLGGNYGPEWLWGRYNYLHPVGRVIGVLTAVVTTLTIVAIFIRRGFAEHSRWIILSLGAVIVAFIAVASLAGSIRQDARFMFPVGILVLITWFLILKDTWRHVAIALILATDATYLVLDSHDSMMYVYSSRGANSLASSLLALKGPGKNGIVVGNPDNAFTVGGGYQWNPANQRKGATFSAVNLDSSVQIDPFIEGDTIDQGLYDFGLALSGFGPHRTPIYRWVAVNTVLQIVGAADLDNVPVHRVLGSKDNWDTWQWRSPPEFVDGALKLAWGVEGSLSLPAQELNERWLVMRARALDDVRAPMRLQVNWHARGNNRFLSTTFRVVNPDETLNAYSTMLYAPPDAETGLVYATLHSETNGVIEVQSIELR